MRLPRTLPPVSKESTESRAILTFSLLSIIVSSGRQSLSTTRITRGGRKVKCFLRPCRCLKAAHQFTPNLFPQHPPCACRISSRYNSSLSSALWHGASIVPLWPNTSELHVKSACLVYLQARHALRMNPLKNPHTA